MTARYRHPEAIVSTAWLAEHGEAPELRLFDCTTYLRYLDDGADAPYRVESGRADYDAGHLPGAAFLDLQADLSDNDAPAHLRFRMLPLPTLAERFQAGDHELVDDAAGGVLGDEQVAKEHVVEAGGEADDESAGAAVGGDRAGGFGDVVRADLDDGSDEPLEGFGIVWVVVLVLLDAPE